MVHLAVLGGRELARWEIEKVKRKERGYTIEGVFNASVLCKAENQGAISKKIRKKALAQTKKEKIRNYTQTK